MTRKNNNAQSLAVLHPDSAGIDIGASVHVVALPPNRCGEPVKTFKAFSAELHAMADWLVDHDISTVAMESTGVYWVPVYEVLELKGLDVVLSHARDTRSVPGRKTDVSDAQ